MKIVISGGTGLVGKEITSLLQQQGHEIWALSRQKTDIEKKIFHWDPLKKEIDPQALKDCDAVIHLAGENIGSSLRWTEEKKEKIRNSRVEGTRFLVEEILKSESPLKTFISASAIGYYGDTGDRPVDEKGASADDFLGKVCKEWEKAAEPLLEKGIRVVQARFGVVLSPNGGALQKMLTPFKLCLGGVLGSGKQFMSWIALDDLARALYFCLTENEISGPVNCVSPNPVTNQEFTKTLGKVLRRPTIFWIPEFKVKLLFGEMGKALFLQSSYVLPNVLEKKGFEFFHPHLEEALDSLLRN